MSESLCQEAARGGKLFGDMIAVRKEALMMFDSAEGDRVDASMGRWSK
jgi:hypothetical protein